MESFILVTIVPVSHANSPDRDRPERSEGTRDAHVGGIRTVVADETANSVSAARGSENL